LRVVTDRRERAAFATGKRCVIVTFVFREAGTETELGMRSIKKCPTIICRIKNTVIPCVAWWLSGKALDLRFTGRGFSSRPVAFT